MANGKNQQNILTSEEIEEYRRLFGELEMTLRDAPKLIVDLLEKLKVGQVKEYQTSVRHCLIEINNYVNRAKSEFERQYPVPNIPKPQVETIPAR